MKIIEKLAIWYLKRKTNYLWEVYNEGFRDGIEQVSLQIQYDEEMEDDFE